MEARIDKRYQGA
jgi:hypothetical protein